MLAADEKFAFFLARLGATVQDGPPAGEWEQEHAQVCALLCWLFDPVLSDSTRCVDRPGLTGSCSRALVDADVKNMFRHTRPDLARIGD